MWFFTVGDCPNLQMLPLPGTAMPVGQLQSNWSPQLFMVKNKNATPSYEQEWAPLNPLLNGEIPSEQSRALKAGEHFKLYPTFQVSPEESAVGRLLCSILAKHLWPKPRPRLTLLFCWHTGFVATAMQEMRVRPFWLLGVMVLRCDYEQREHHPGGGSCRHTVQLPLLSLFIET